MLVDINPNAVSYLIEKFPNFKILISDLFQDIKGKFDLIVFNYLYLPEDKYDKELDTCGGKNGSEIINKFLKQAKEHLNQNGKIILLTSSLTKNTNWPNYKKKIIGKKNFSLKRFMFGN